MIENMTLMSLEVCGLQTVIYKAFHFVENLSKEDVFVNSLWPLSEDRKTFKISSTNILVERHTYS